MAEPVPWEAQPGKYRIVTIHVTQYSDYNRALTRLIVTRPTVTIRHDKAIFKQRLLQPENYKGSVKALPSSIAVPKLAKTILQAKAYSDY